MATPDEWTDATREGLASLAEALAHVKEAQAILDSLALPYPLTKRLTNVRGQIMANLGSIPRPIWQEIKDAW